MPIEHEIDSEQKLVVATARAMGQQTAAPNGMPGAHGIGIAAGHQGRPGWSARGTHVEVSEAHGSRMERIHIRRLDYGVAVTSEVTVALIVADDQDDIGALDWALRRQ